MPSTTQKQANLMSAIKHGWHPPASMKHAPSLAVATEFHEADKRAGRFEHPSYGEGGKVANVVSFAKSVLPQIEKEFSNTYTADTDRLRQLISKYWATRPPEAPAAAAEALPPTVPLQGYADGGSVSDDRNLTQKGLDIISHAADRASSWLGTAGVGGGESTDPHHLLARVAAGLASQVVGQDSKGRPQLGKMPGIVRETEAIPAGLVDIGEGVTRLGASGADALDAQGHGGPPALGLFQGARALLDRLHSKYGSDLAPAWSRNAEASADSIHQGTRAAMGLPAPRGLAENLAEAGGTMLGQLPIGAEKAAEGTLAKIAKSPIEWLGPTIRPSLRNYGAGTLAGGLMGSAGDQPQSTAQVTP